MAEHFTDYGRIISLTNEGGQILTDRQSFHFKHINTDCKLCLGDVISFERTLIAGTYNRFKISNIKRITESELSLLGVTVPSELKFEKITRSPIQIEEVWPFKPIIELSDEEQFEQSIKSGRLIKKRFDSIIENLKVIDEKETEKKQAHYLKHFIEWFNFAKFPARFEDFVFISLNNNIQHEIRIRFIKRIFLECNEDFKHKIITDLIETLQFTELDELKIAKIEHINESFRLSFNDVHFKYGYIAFTKYIDRLKHEVDFKIINDNILPEFDHIKFWFSRKLKARDFKVKVEVVVKSGEIISTTADAPIFSKINTDLIEGIRIQRTYSLNQVTKNHKPDKSLFTSDDIFDEINSEDREGNVFNQSEAEILKYFLEKTNIRNRKHLGYLAGKKQSENQKLLFTLNPDFGFLFFIEGEKSNHFIWELLNSHATYVWSIGRDEMAKELQFKRIEQTINTIYNLGRQQYKSAYHTGHTDEDLSFNFVYHDKAGSDIVDGFPLWKARINELLV